MRPTPDIMEPRSLPVIESRGKSFAAAMHMAENQKIVPDGLPRLRIRDVDGLAVVGIDNAESLFEEGAIRELSTRLNCLVDEGHTRLVLNFGGVRYMASGVLATLAGLHLR